MTKQVRKNYTAEFKREAVRLVKARNSRFTEEILEYNRLCCGIVSHGKASDVWKSACRKDFLAQKRPFFLPDSRIIQANALLRLASQHYNCVNSINE